MFENANTTHVESFLKRTMVKMWNIVVRYHQRQQESPEIALRDWEMHAWLRKLEYNCAFATSYLLFHDV
jgi:hypothetical protein